MAILAVIIVYLLTCKHQDYTPPKVTTVPELKERIRVDSIISQKQKDSINDIIKAKEKTALYWQNAFNVAANETRSLEDNMNELLVAKVPDTCLKYQAFITSEYNRLALAQAQKDKANKNIIIAKDNIIANKDKLISKGKHDYENLRVVTDTCFKNQTILEKALKKANRHEIFVGVSALSSYNKVQPTIGINLGYRARNGYYVEAGINLRKEVSISIKKTLFKF
jgi:hypothetical protein